jgi:hypothetical protein
VHSRYIRLIRVLSLKENETKVLLYTYLLEAHKKSKTGGLAMDKVLSLNVVLLSLDVIGRLTIGVLAGGVFFVVISICLKKWNEKKENYWKSFFQDFCRDIGIAFAVAGLVTVVYGNVLDFQRFSDAVGLMIGESVPQSVWDKTKTQVFQRDVLRGNYEATWQIVPERSMPPDQVILKVRIKYTIYGLKSQPFEYSIQQELENMHLFNTAKKLPRFDRVTIVGAKVYEGIELEQLVKNGLLTLPLINLNEWKKTEPEYELQTNKGTDIIFERSEIINLPGAYSTVLSGLTKNIRLQIETADDIQFELKEWFVSNGKGFEKTGNYFIYNGVALPGQSISVQFWRKSDTKQEKR